MLDLIRLLIPPEWTVWSLLQKAVYWAVFLSIMAVVSWFANGIADAVFQG